MKLFGRMLNAEFINGCGVFLEFSDSRAVWCHNHETGEMVAMAFEGVMLSLPFILITYGRVYEEVEL